MESFYVLVCFLLGWFVAQFLKLVSLIIEKRGKIKTVDAARMMLKSGGMPSGHTASMTAVAVMIGILEGFDSVIFALAVSVLVIIMYDAINVRYAVGKQGKVLNGLIAHHQDMVSVKSLKVVEGHTVLETVAGFILGVLVAILMALLTGSS